MNWAIAIGAGALGVWAIVTAKWEGNVIQLPTGRFFWGIALLLVDAGFVVGRLL